MIAAACKSHLTFSFSRLSLVYFSRTPEERFHNKLVWAPLRPADSQIQLKHDANIPANTPYYSQRNAGFQSQLCPM